MEKSLNFKGNKIIAFANQKGGVGKTTLCGLFANYLTSKGVPVLVIDADLQLGLSGTREADIKELKLNYPEEDPNSFIKYNIRKASLNDKDATDELMTELRNYDFTTIIDSPGSLAQDGMVAMLANCDYIVCPYLFDLNTIRATRSFVHVVYLLKKQFPAIKSQIIFVANRKKTAVGTKAEKEAWKSLEEYFSNFGIVLSDQRIGDYKAVQDFNTVSISKDQLTRIGPAFDKMFNIIYGE